MKAFILESCPWLTKIFRIKIGDDYRNNFYRSLVHDTISRREKESIIRPDMINLLMKARREVLQPEENEQRGADSCVTVSEQSINSKTMIWDDDDLTAQCFVFYIAGFDTSSTLLCFAAHEIMENKVVQKKLIAEIDEMNKELNGKPLTYDVLQNMKYLDMVISGRIVKY